MGPKQSPLFPLSSTQRESLSRELTALVCRYRTVEANKKAIVKSATDQLKALRALMEQHAQTLWDTDEDTQKVDIDRLIEDLTAGEEDSR